MIVYMRAAVFSTKSYDRRYLESANGYSGDPHELVFFEPRLTVDTVALAEGFDAVCVFVNDELDSRVLGRLGEYGVRAVALRCAGFNHVDLAAAGELGIRVVRVPAYSPHGVAEHTVALILALNRKLHRAYHRVREGNFALEGLLGFELHGRAAGVIGTGAIGRQVAMILLGFGCDVTAYDIKVDSELENRGVRYVELDELFRGSDIISLHCPLTAKTHHLIDGRSLGLMKEGVMIINTSRGGLVDTAAVIESLKGGRVGYLGLDVYEEEEELFFEDRSSNLIRDDTFARLLTFPNVLITGHQAFFTQTALEQIAQTTIANLSCIEHGRECGNTVEAAARAAVRGD